ncbi:MAG: DUF4342 domain-containing protein [Anaeromicrobium sp.]|jgi:translation elongation factor EF-Ts|uniref:DUF4342 domain-containing protein n=1 Tax=Anaeromicrobium sp. TaxID=1929132 RepID=UPI0025FF92EC|nr:DUF4342 domain-containing protein [Anaeromicrobium sp.]MCT4594582.1 DUF4342 domain-containing protein [Anaeromicrobium sp.]
MEINLEKVDAVRDRTGVSYKEAKEALEMCNGDVIDTIIHIEEKNGGTWGNNLSDKGNEVMDKVKELLKKGNVTRIQLKRNHEIVMNIPITAGAIGAIISPPIAVLGLATALVSKCRVEIVKDDGEVIDVNEMTKESIDNVVDKVNEYKDKFEPNGSSQPEKKEESEFNKEDENK